MSSTASEHTHHAIDYVELTVADLEAAKRFYAAAFGWSFTDYGPDYAGFADRARAGKEAGGLCRGDAAPARPGAALVLLYSQDLEATLEAVRAAGGGVTKEIFAFPGGRRFQFSDPGGNELGVWSDR